MNRTQKRLLAKVRKNSLLTTPTLNDQELYIRASRANERRNRSEEALTLARSTGDVINQARGLCRPAERPLVHGAHRDRTLPFERKRERHRLLVALDAHALGGVDKRVREVDSDDLVPLGWNSVVRPALLAQYARVRRINDTRLTLRLPPCPRYQPGARPHAASV